MKKYIAISGLLLGLASPLTHAAQFTVTVENLTHGIYFTPLLVAAHDSNTYLFKSGEKASTALQKMAEGGALDDLVSNLNSKNAHISTNPANGLLAPSASATTPMINIGTSNNNYLSVVGMMLPTNDGFIGLNSYKIPSAAGTYTVNINAYDAGTEANNELIVAGSGAPNTLGIPAAPGGKAGTNGTGVTTTEDNQKVHIHRGSLGDDNATGGKSDLDNTVHRWLNPVARVTITVQ